jgi:hypothetical protein
MACIFGAFRYGLKPMNYFRKELPESAVYVNGFPMRFDFLATEDPALVAELNKCVAKGVGGIVSITKEEYDLELSKKNAATSPEALRPHPSLPHRQEIISPNLHGPRVAEVVANPGGSRNGMFARPQVGDRQGWPPQNRVGNGSDARHGPMPDPIQIPSPAQFAPPPTAKVNPNDLK